MFRRSSPILTLWAAASLTMTKCAAWRKSGSEKRMQFFLFPAEKDPKDGSVTDFSDWRFVTLEGWTGAVQQRNGVCFMAALRGREKDLAPYLEKKKQ